MLKISFATNKYHCKIEKEIIIIIIIIKLYKI